MSWTEIWVTYLQPIVAFLVGSGEVAFISRFLANSTLNKLYNKRNLENMSKKVVDNVVAKPIKIDIEDKVDKHLEKIDNTFKKENAELRAVIKAQNNVFKAISNLFKNSYAINDSDREALDKAIEEADNIVNADNNTASDQQLIVQIEQKNNTSVAEKTTTNSIKR